jgi:hypothetical protein
MKDALWKCRAMDAEENQSRVSLRAHRPWKSRCDSHIPTAPAKAMEKWKAKTRLSTFPPPGCLPLKYKLRKEA